MENSQGDPYQAAIDRLVHLQGIIFEQWRSTTSQLAECQAERRMLEIQNENLKAAVGLDLLRQKQEEVNRLQAQLKADEIAIQALRARLIEAGIIVE